MYKFIKRVFKPVDDDKFDFENERMDLVIRIRLREITKDKAIFDMLLRGDSTWSAYVIPLEVGQSANVNDGQKFESPESLKMRTGIAPRSIETDGLVRKLLKEDYK